MGLLVLRLGVAALLIGFHGWPRLHRAVDYVFFGEPCTVRQLCSVIDPAGPTR